MVDLYGEAVQCNITIGDLYRKKHDTFKMRLFQMFERAGMDVEVEVFNLFAGSILQEGLSRMEIKSQQSIVPDMRMELKLGSLGRVHGIVFIFVLWTSE